MLKIKDVTEGDMFIGHFDSFVNDDFYKKHFIKTKVLKDELGRALRRAYDLRQKGDYATGFIVAMREAKKSIEATKRFVAEAEEYLNSKIC